MTVKLKRIVFAVTDMPSMVDFYNHVFDADLQPVGEPQPLQFYRGTLAGIDVLFCPNEIAKVVAESTRHQLCLLVDDLQGTINTAIAHGGVQTGAIENGVTAICDPEGNSIELASA